MHSTYFISLIQIDTKLIQRSKFTSLGRNLFVLVVHLSIIFLFLYPISSKNIFWINYSDIFFTQQRESSAHWWDTQKGREREKGGLKKRIRISFFVKRQMLPPTTTTSTSPSNVDAILPLLIFKEEREKKNYKSWKKRERTLEKGKRKGSIKRQFKVWFWLSLVYRQWFKLTSYGGILGLPCSSFSTDFF